MSYALMCYYTDSFDIESPSALSQDRQGRITQIPLSNTNPNGTLLNANYECCTLIICVTMLRTCSLLRLHHTHPATTALRVLCATLTAGRILGRGTVKSNRGGSPPKK